MRKPFFILCGIILVLNVVNQHVSCRELLNSFFHDGKGKHAGIQFTGNQQLLNKDITQSRQNAITRAVKNVSPAVVGINVIQVRRYVQQPLFDDPFWDWFYPRGEYQQKVKGLGSGFLISPDGYILTNEHVVHEALQIIVTTTDGKQYEAKSIGENATYDVALLKIEGKQFQYIPLGNSDDVIIGEWVIALGNPFGLFDVNSKPTVTVGVISSNHLNFQGDLKIRGRSYTDMLQTDASINGGNSGGPLVNSKGYCIGINTFIISGSNYQKTSIGISFAIPINRVKEILPDLKSIKKSESSFRTGLEVENISRLVALMLGISPDDGVIVSHVGLESSAERAGLRVGDVVVKIDEIRVHSTAEVQRVVNSINLTRTKSLTLTVFRNGTLFKVELDL